MLISSRPLSMLACNAIPWFLQARLDQSLSMYWVGAIVDRGTFLYF